METALKLAIETYAQLIGNMTIQEVTKSIADGNETVKNSVMMLMFVSA